MSTSERRHGMFVFGVGCAAFGLLVGALSLLGWIVGDDRLKGAFIAGITVKTNTAISLTALGLALLALARERRPVVVTLAARVLGGFAAICGGLTLVQHVAGIDLGIDQLFFREPTGALSTSSPNRMGPPASICFLLLGLATFLIDRPETRRGRTIAPGLAVAALVVCLVPLLGYAFEVKVMYGVARFTGIAFQTALGLTALALAVVALRPGVGFMADVLADDPGGVLMRRLLPAAIFLPVGITWLRIAGEQTGLYDRDFGRVLLVLLFMVLFAFLTFWTGSAVRRQDIARLAAVREREDSLRESDRRKNEFLATLAHELRNPLAPVRNAIGLLQLKGITDPDHRWAHAMIERQIAHLARLIDDLMDVSRIERGKLELQREQTTLAEILSAVVDHGRSAVEAAGLTVVAELPGEALPLRADPVRLVQVFSNLLTNAVKFTPPGGSIRIEARRDGEEAIVRVTDTGIGIAAESQARLFEMFFQADIRHHGSGGLGIGLALVRNLVELHGGRVSATSPGPGRGSTFEVRLPLEPASTAGGASDRGRTERTAVAGEAHPPDSALLAGRRILVVDDNRDAAVSLAALLARAGATIDLAHDGEEGLARALATAPDTMVLDLGLPGLDGYQLASEIRARTGRSGTPGAPLLVALTGWGQENDQARSRAAGFDHHLIKPIAPDTLLDLLGGAARSPGSGSRGD